MTLQQTFNHWLGGIRLYIAIAIVAVTVEVWWWASTSYGGSALFGARLEETYAWLALGLLVTAVSIGPLTKVFPRLPGKQLLFDARRLFGVGAAWFASLHATIAYVSQFKAVNPLDLPKNYQQAFAFGAVALLILLAMAFTSFDKALRSMGRWWFRLHRLVYVAVLATLFHAFAIGVHATQKPELIVLTVAALGLVSLHAYISFARQDRPSAWQVITLSTTVILLIAIFNYGYSQNADSSAAKAGQYQS